MYAGFWIESSRTFHRQVAGSTSRNWEVVHQTHSARDRPKERSPQAIGSGHRPALRLRSGFFRQPERKCRLEPEKILQSPAFLYHSKSPLSFLAKIFPDISCGLRGVLQGRFCYNRGKRGIPRLFSTEGRMSYGQRTRRAQARTVIPLL